LLLNIMTACFIDRTARQGRKARGIGRVGGTRV
jgi:hypothetical protein